jgi:hypothetical protein
MEGIMNKVGRILPLLVALLLFVQQCTAAKTCYSGDRDALLAFKARKCKLMVQKKKNPNKFVLVGPSRIPYFLCTICHM